MELKIVVKFANLDPTGKNIFMSFEPTIEKILDDNHFEKLLLKRLPGFKMLSFEPPNEALQKLKEDTSQMLIRARANIQIRGA